MFSIVVNFLIIDWFHVSTIICDETCVAQLYKHDRNFVANFVAQYRREEFRCTISTKNLRKICKKIDFKSNMRWNNNIFVRWTMNEMICQWFENWSMNAFIDQQTLIDKRTTLIDQYSSLINERVLTLNLKLCSLIDQWQTLTTSFVHSFWKTIKCEKKIKITKSLVKLRLLVNENQNVNWYELSSKFVDFFKSDCRWFGLQWIIVYHVGQFLKKLIWRF